MAKGNDKVVDVILVEDARVKFWTAETSSES